MHITELKTTLLGEKLTKVQNSQDCTVYCHSGENGDMTVTIYTVFPGIYLIYNDVHIPSCSIAIDHPVGNVVEIEHCREGRIECRDEDNFFYLSQGDISIRKKAGTGRELEFPLSHYHGLAILLDLDQVPRCLTCLLDGVDIEPAHLVERFSLEDNHHVALRQLPNIEHIFAELYTVPESIRKGYHKVKVLEVLLFLSSLEPERDELHQRRFSRKQVQLAKDVSAFLTNHLNERITIEELAKRFSTSPTMLKASFRGVYGVSVQTFQRQEKMRSAARLLRTTDMTVQEIAGMFGYANSSKFSSAFQSVMEMTPNEYRQK